MPGRSDKVVRRGTPRMATVARTRSACSSLPASARCAAGSRTVAGGGALIDGHGPDDDDGSQDWGRASDCFGVFSILASGRRPAELLAECLEVFVDGVFNALANQIADEQSGGLTQVDAERLVASRPEWATTVAFVLDVAGGSIQQE